MKKFQVQYRRNGKWVTGNSHHARKDAVEEAVKRQKARAFDGYQIVEVE